ncbi:methyl-accepting chemotaxis protein [Defluviitalea phaphyphila]|uniref:methyl-accepting chemotaxis protein n=1 Tax=Defluviitalea phaphyphila TaxID=1473580 RepID=UPI00072FE550|nr:methyl-accepting chemotaxis protein [Defluviitalea phaphyphila]
MKKLSSVNFKLKKRGGKNRSFKNLFNSRYNMGIGKKLIISFILLSIIPLSLVGIFSYYNAEKTVKDKVSFYSKQMIVQLMLNINSKIEEIERMSMMIQGNVDFISTLEEMDKEESYYAKLQAKNTAENALFAIRNSDVNIKGIYLYRKDGTKIGIGTDSVLNEKHDNGNNNEMYELFKKYLEENNKDMVWMTGLNDSYQNIYLLRTIKSIQTIQEVGILVISVDSEYITSPFKNIQTTESSDIYILNENKVNIGDLNKDDLGKEMNYEYLDTVFSGGLSDSFIEKGNIVSYATTTNGWKIITDESVSSLMSEMNFVKQSILAIVIICIILSVAIGSLIAFSISGPIKNIMNLMSKAENGDLTVSSKIKGKNEIGRLSQSFNKMIENIHNLINEVNHVLKQVEEGAEIIKIESEQSAASSTQVSTAINEIAQGASEQAKQAEEGYHLMEALDKNINNVVKRIENVIEMISRTKESRDYAENTISKLNIKTQNAVESTQAINEEIKNLDREANEIIKVVQAIENISEQTNLLALNAAIEAARAGEAGKGFAVVAEEIRKLAMDSKDSTKMISDIISRIQLDVKNTVSMVKTSDKIFEEQSIIVNETENSFKEMAESISKVIQEIEDINSSITEIEGQKNKTTEAIGNIAAIIEESAASVEEVTATSEEQTSFSEQLASLANNLRESIQTLKKSVSKFELK